MNKYIVNFANLGSDIPENNKKPTMQQIFPKTPSDPLRAVPSGPACQPPRIAQSAHQLSTVIVRESGQEELCARVQEGT